MLQPHRFGWRPAPAVGVGVRRALLPWLDLDLRVGGTFAVVINSRFNPNEQCDQYDREGLPDIDFARGNVVMSAGGALRLRPFGSRRPFDLSLGLRGYLAVLTAADPISYRCGRGQPLGPGPYVLSDVRELPRPAAVGGVIALTAGIGAHAGPRDMIGTTLEGMVALDGEGRSAGVRFAVSVTLF